MPTIEDQIINVQEIEPRLRHLTIFQAFDKLNKGESLIIHNNHDPRPVYYQLVHIRGEIFTWEYLEEGPEWWDVKVTKISDQEDVKPQEAEAIIDVPSIEPRLKHATIFQTFMKLKKGESFIIHNNHDPRPVYYQLMDLKGNIFSWEYLKQGPEWWDIRVTRTVPMIPMEEGKLIINVPALEPSVKHATIFHVFENMNTGESFIIHNDHDPKPLYYQLQEKHGDTFTWDYIQQGPHWFDILITRKTPASNETTETIIDIPSIEPSKKHETIFRMFEQLNPGESFIIHNNHDPRPVYYQMTDMYGDVFSWEYLRQGPQWWDIRVGKKLIQQYSQPAHEEKPAYLSEENVINVPDIEPRFKHSTIFETFDKLQPGQSLIIHNDHDPKPLYYQLKSERGEVFTWEYLCQGPKWWDIRVTRLGTESNETIGEIVAKDHRKAEVFKKYGIDFCCGGKKTVRQVCQEKGINPVDVERELQQPQQGPATSGGLNYNEWNPDFLADYIVNTHHNYVRKYLPEIKGYAIKVAGVHGDRHPELLEIKDLFEDVYDELTEHIREEENQLFPLIKSIVKSQDNGEKIDPASLHLAEKVAETEKEHDDVGRAMEKIRSLSDDYAIPDDACTSYKLLYKMLEEFENDLFTHIHLENNILFPKAINLENKIVKG
ncbi:MAG: iron-sulfur cluster repair di-iron protein [Saprospiraceae bacterium]|nr:iron-sulfur cluster repair di-iron protein [Saprospiraceae bacterium]